MKNDLDLHKRRYEAFLLTEDGKYILEDLKNAFCVHPDFLVNTGDKQLDNHLKEGLRIAFNYIIKPF